METRIKEIKVGGEKFIITDGDTEIGSAYLYVLENSAHDRPFGLIEYVIINENYRGQGLGTGLVKRMIESAKKHNCYKIIMTSRYERPKVHALYEKLGFKDVGKEFRMDFG